jgi:hypothetical protein
VSTHTFRNKDQILLPREAIRQWLPIGRLGFSIEDLDASLRLFNQKYNPVGTFRLCEHKVGTDEIGWSKEWHFALYDTLFRKADPSLSLYKGYYVINTPTDDWMQCDLFRVNGVEMSQGEFRRWLWWDSIEYWKSIQGEISDQDLLNGCRLAWEAGVHELLNVPPYQFKTFIAAKIRSQLAKGDPTDG